MKKRLPLILILLLSWAAHAETVYVTDNIKLSLRSGPSVKNKIVKMLSSGTPLTVLKRDSSGYLKVQTSKGTEGYILSHHTKKNHTNNWYLKKTNEQLVRLRNKNQQMQTELDALKSKHTDKNSDNLALNKPRDQINQEFSELQQIAANMPQLKQQRDQLQERVVNAERELQQLKREKQTLEDSTNQSWFIYGGILAFAGIFLGLIIPKLSWQKKSSSWDTF